MRNYYKSRLGSVATLAALLAVAMLPAAPVRGQQPAVAGGATVNSFYDFKTDDARR